MHLSQKGSHMEKAPIKNAEYELLYREQSNQHGQNNSIIWNRLRRITRFYLDPTRLNTKLQQLHMNSLESSNWETLNCEVWGLDKILVHNNTIRSNETWYSGGAV